MAKFEVVSTYADKKIPLPWRGTSQSAGYDFIVAEDTIVPSYSFLMSSLTNFAGGDYGEPISLEQMSYFTKATKAKPTLVPTGIKCRLEYDEFLSIVPRSSTPLKYWLTVANSPGTVDADYYGNPDNEGHIFIQVINFSPFDIILHKGDKIAQGIIQKYKVVDDDYATETRVGGFGSTDEVK